MVWPKLALEVHRQHLAAAQDRLAAEHRAGFSKVKAQRQPLRTPSAFTRASAALPMKSPFFVRRESQARVVGE